MKRWIGPGLLAATLMVTACVSNRYDRDYRFVIIATDIIGMTATAIGAATVKTGARRR